MTNSLHSTNPNSVSRRKLLQHGVAISASTVGAVGIGVATADAGKDTELLTLWQLWLDQGARTLDAQDAADEMEKTADAWDAIDMAARREWEKLAAISDQIISNATTSASGRAVKAAVLPVLALRNATAWQYVISNGGNTMRLREALEAGNA